MSITTTCRCPNKCYQPSQILAGISLTHLTVRTEVISCYRRCSEDDLKAVREEKEIPELEKEGEREDPQNKGLVVENGDGMKYENDSEMVTVQDSVNQNHEEQKGLGMIETPREGRELLDALKDIVDHFIRAHDSRKDVSRMLEASKVHLQSGLEGLKGGFQICQCALQVLVPAQSS